MNWQPIETAKPNDLVDILVWCPEGRYTCTGYFRNGIWQDVGGFEIHPTHWCEIIPPQPVIVVQDKWGDQYVVEIPAEWQEPQDEAKT